MPLTAYHFPRAQTISPDVAERRAARKKGIERAYYLSINQSYLEARSPLLCCMPEISPGC
jgi:hypothetical protein